MFASVEPINPEFEAKRIRIRPRPFPTQDMDEANLFQTLLTQGCRLSSRRAFWLTLFAFAAALEAGALILQYQFGLEPCVLCVYERAVVAGLGLVGLLAAMAPRRRAFRVAGVFSAIALTIEGIWLALEHLGAQFGTLSLSCNFAANFPSWMPLDRWLPAVFEPRGFCDEVQFQLLGLSLPGWLLLTLIGLLVALLLVGPGAMCREGEAKRG